MLLHYKKKPTLKYIYTHTAIYRNVTSILHLEMCFMAKCISNINAKCYEANISTALQSSLLMIDSMPHSFLVEHTKHPENTTPQRILCKTLSDLMLSVTPLKSCILHFLFIKLKASYAKRAIAPKHRLVQFCKLTRQIIAPYVANILSDLHQTKHKATGTAQTEQEEKISIVSSTVSPLHLSSRLRREILI